MKRPFDLAIFMQDEPFMLCPGCGNDACDHNFPFSRLCDACLEQAKAEAEDLMKAAEAFAKRYTYSPGHIQEFAEWVLSRKTVGKPIPANPDYE